ncbi:MAG: hypothetical protein K0R61_13 [Microvirga sp.]|jgi:hypothetical protein|nr:hypothetical protein [Microvirga sp.]MDF2969563.1 hypothetical protein [Microvirga sp.]
MFTEQQILKPAFVLSALRSSAEWHANRDRPHSATIDRDAIAAIERLIAERDGEREARHKVEKALAAKDEAMGVLFERLAAAGVDCSDLIP